MIKKRLVVEDEDNSVDRDPTKQDPFPSEDLYNLGKYFLSRYYGRSFYEEILSVFTLGALEALNRRKLGLGIRTYQIRYGEGYVKTFLTKQVLYDQHHTFYGDEYAIEDKVEETTGEVHEDHHPEEQRELRLWLIRKIRELPDPRLRRVLWGRFFRNRTLQAVGDRFNPPMTRERMRQLETIGLNLLREKIEENRDNLQAVLDILN